MCGRETNREEGIRTVQCGTFILYPIIILHFFLTFLTFISFFKALNLPNNPETLQIDLIIRKLIWFIYLYLLITLKKII